MRINPISLVGIVLIVLGILAIPDTSRERAIDGVPLQASFDIGIPILISPLSMGLVLVGGAALVRGWVKKSS